MPIVVPPSNYASAPPQINRDRIPKSEHPALFHILDLLGSLGRYEQRFKLALKLFDLCCTENSDLVSQMERGQISFVLLDLQTNTLSGWRLLAARDGALAIYHFGQALIAIASNLRTCPTLCACVDHSAIRLARHSFVATFPNYSAVRHAVSHIADFSTTLAEREKHSIKGPWKGNFGRVGIELKDEGALHRFEDNLYDITYCITFEGAVHQIEISNITLDVLSKIKNNTYTAFDASL
jgi:hypothetical protein